MNGPARSIAQQTSTAKSEGQSLTRWIAERSGKIFGFRITPTTPTDIIAATSKSIEHEQQLIIAHQNMHGLYLANTHSEFRDLHNLPQTLVHIDGFPLVYLAWLHGLRQTKMEHRAAIHDWLPDFARAASKKQWRLYCLGSNADVSARAVQTLREVAPQATITGRDGYFDASKNSKDNRAVLDEIAAFNPDILLVGMGMGRQEQWILDNHQALGDRCIIAVGACLEYMAGEMQMSPRWFGPFGLEAAWRLFSRPRRYAHRYLVEPWLLLGMLIKSGRLFGRVP